ncbi:quinol:electron acceptor oxidoreductase subunit ActD [uncultured Methylobacterium sp.]|jgi:Ni/Fe-hydrogenase subunit HybB-like protein|uniref:quinol:electron acceptor oxidoreductase subunit ActD n=1 Tax=uncultured Methylobacterium sp. TaxID=157278 RepID=UPI00261EABE2|nr:quinol:electron acceptor oxidoreductase subunit ActD [uncultured Methylobacterium sp.]
MSGVSSLARPAPAGLGALGRDAAGPALDGRAPRRWWLVLAGAAALVGLFAAALAWLLIRGVGIWDNNNPVVWALDIVSYDWWIGIASGALLAAAVLTLLGTEWRSGVSRIAETVAVLAAAAAALYPIAHLGRPWKFYWTLPTPNTLGLWPQFRSPLVWDAVDIIGFLGVSLTLWGLGLLPDLAYLRDRAFEAVLAEIERRGRPRRLTLLRAQLYGIVALGWRGSAVHWARWAQACRVIALLAVGLILALQTGASVMLAGSLLPGWHDTLLPVTFLVNALLSGVGVTAALAVVLRRALGLNAVVTVRHLAVLARLLLLLGLASAYCYGAELLSAALHGDAFDRAVILRRLAGDHAWAFWTIVALGLLPVQVFWWRRARRSGRVLALVGLAVAVASFADHFMLLVVTLGHDFLPSSAHAYRMGFWGLATFAGSVGLFLALLLIALRLLPMVSLVEARQVATTRPAPPPNRGRDATEAETRDAPLWGISAEFDSDRSLATALHALGRRDVGARLDAYGPVPMPETARALDLPASHIPLIGLGAAVAAGAGFMGLCLYASGIDYVFDVGGRPRFSWPAFLVPSASLAMLGGTLAVLATLLVASRLPRLNHPAFNIPDFPRASSDRFFLAVEMRDPDRFDPARVERVLATLPEMRPLSIRRVPR